jgi:ketol-acid reductoisomerase
LITDLIQETGISGMRRRVSNTACYGDLTRGPLIINERARKTMKKLLKEIKSGKFAREWIKENEMGRPVFNKLLQDGDNHPIEEVGRRLREMMPWMKK